MDKEKEILFEDIRPFIRNIRVINSSQISELSVMKSYDNIMIYVNKGNSVVKINDSEYRLGRGSVLMWKHIMPYQHILPEGDVKYIVVNFDYTNDNINISYPLYSENIKNFDSKKIIQDVKIINSTLFNSIIYLNEMQFIEENLWIMKNEFDKKERYFGNKLSGIMIGILSDIARYATDRIVRGNNKVNLVKEVSNYISEHFQEEINNKLIGEKFKFHPNYINSLFKTHTGYSLHQYLIMRRISKAINLLQETNLPISEISGIVGFKSINHFSRFFKKTIGTSPRDFREQSSR